MKLNIHMDTSAFLQIIQSCAGDVYFETEEGDILNLKSTLCRYLFVTIPVSSGLLKNGKVTCTNQADYQILKDYLEEDDLEDTIPERRSDGKCI